MVGEGGKGIKFMSNIFSQICSSLGYSVSLVYQYDSNVRGGLIESRIVLSDKKIESPFFDEADFLIKLSRPKHNLKYDSKITIYDINAVRNKKNHKRLIEIPFEEISDKLFNSKKHANMIALGKLLKCLDLINSEKELKEKTLPRLDKKHLEAIKYGLSYKEILQ